MGIFDFVKDAGDKIFGSDEDEQKVEQAARQAEEAARAQTASEEEARRAAEAAKNAAVAQGLVAVVERMQIEVEDLRIEFDGHMATIYGSATQSDREKVILLVGNSQGIGQVDDRLEVKDPEPEATFYTVVKGDTLSKIAKAHYGDMMKYPVIFEANKPMLKDPDLIYPGQQLRIPPL